MKIAIIDDDKQAREELNELLQGYRGHQTIDVKTFVDAEDFLNNKPSEYSIVLLDIDMPKMNGIELASKIIDIKPTMIIIFVTNYDSYTKQAFRSNVFQYLTKPIVVEDLYYDIERAIDKVFRQVKKIKITSKGIEVLLNISDIEHVESYKRIIKIFMKDGIVYESYMRLKDLHDFLAGFDFATSHISYLVNLDVVEVIGQEHIKLMSGVILPVSRKFRSSFKDKFNIYLSGVLL